MAYKKTFWKDRIVEKPNTYKQINNPDGTITLQPMFGQVIEQGTPFNAASLNKIEDGIIDVYNHINSGGNFRIFKTIKERDKETNVEDGMICYVDEEGVYYSRKNDEWEIFKSGSGGDGGTSIGTLTSPSDGQTMSVSTGDTLEVDIFFSTPNVGAGTVYVTSNGKEIQKKAISMGSNKLQLNLAKGTHKIEIYAVDRGGVYTNIIRFTVQCGGLEIDTTFDWEDNYKVGSTIAIPYSIETISKEPVEVHFIVGKKEYTQTATSKYNEFKLPTDLGANVYKVEIWATSGTFESNHIFAELIILNSDSLFVSTLFDKTQAEEGDQLIIDYRVSMEGVRDFEVVYSVNDKEHSKGKAISGTNTFAISTLKLGDNTITIKVSTLDKKQEKTLTINIKIVESSYQMQKPVVDASLVAYADAYELSNFSPDREVWKDKKTGEVIGELHNFNYNTNGWINNGLKMNGNAYAKLNIKPFLNNAKNGLTIDVEFKTEDIGNENARVLDCTTTLESGVGCYVDTNEAQIKSKANTVTSPFAQNERTRVTYVIDRQGKITKLYINAVMSAVAKLTDKGTGTNKELEDFKHDDCIYLNSTRGLSNFGDCTVYSVRVYNRALNSEEVLKNHIADIKDKTLQKKKFDFNYHNTIPTMTFVCDSAKFEEMTKKDAVTMQIKYVSTNPTLYGQSFDLPNCEVKWQGTSSIVYAVKNYKIKLYEAPNGTEAEGEKPQKYKHALREGMIEESTFVLKADYMESSHANNTGLAKIVNKYLYDKDKKLPPQETNDKVVSAIDGFPIKLYLNGDLMGVFNFNLDKGNEKSFGFDKKNENCISYEVSANTDTTAGAFNKWNGVATKDIPDELTYLKKDFELRFPDEEDKPDHGYLKQLKRLVDWVSDASDDEFREHFDEYLDKEYTFKYYLFVLTMGMVDNLGKNMMINTWDGNIWYPCFYDLDTCLSLDNSGYIKFDVDIEVEAKTYNTSGSQLWTKVGRVFKNELAAMYRDMRSKTFKEDKLFSVLLDEQIDQIPELLYNDDSQKKYLDHPEYIHMLHGSRREHMRKWLTERLLYLDSKFDYEMNTKEAITVRANKEGYVEFNIKTYSPMYIKVKWRNDADSIKLQKVGRNETVTFGHTLPTATDQEVLVYSAQHLKEIGDISDMKPSSLTLGNATRLTKLICRNSEHLQALGLGGTANGVDKRMKNLQEIDLTGCSKLGTIDSNRGLDVSYCDNLKTLKAQGTKLQNIQFNPDGGNLEEVYMPNTVTSLSLSNQYSLRKIEFPSYDYSDTLQHRPSRDKGSLITDLKLVNCPNLMYFGMSTNINTSQVRNYRGTIIDNQGNNFDISKQEYIQIFKSGCLSNLENVNITNSLLNHKYFNVNASPNLTRISFNKMPKLKGVIFTGNKTYSRWNNNNMEGVPKFEEIQVNECPEFDTIIMQYCTKDLIEDDIAFKFKDNFTWDLSLLPLKRFICNISLQNLKKIILPSSIEEFSHSHTALRNNTDTWTDGSKSQYTKEMSPLETIVIAGGQHDYSFRGIDLASKQLKNVNLNGLTKPVDIIQNVNCEAIDISPRIISQHVSAQLIDNIKINLNKYKGNTLAGLFALSDMSKFSVTLDNELTTKNMDYSQMFYNTSNVSWDNIKNLISKLPKGKLYKTFTNCDANRLEVGHMIGSTTVDLNSCFANMSKVTEISIEGGDFSNVTNIGSIFKDDIVLQRIAGSENLIQEKCIEWTSAFNNTPKLKFEFPQGRPNWSFPAKDFVQLSYFMDGCGKDVVLNSEEYALDLSYYTNKINFGNAQLVFRNSPFTKILLNNIEIGGSNATFTYCPNLKELKITNSVFTGPEMCGIAVNPKLQTLNLENSKMDKITTLPYAKIRENPNLENLTFGVGLKVSLELKPYTKLTKESLMSVIDNIGTANRGAILLLGEAHLGKLTTDEQNKARNKGWTLA